MATSTSIARSIARSLRSEHTLPAPVLDKARLCLVDMIAESPDAGRLARLLDGEA